MGKTSANVVLDPITMTPMLSGSGNITVNPLGVPSKLSFKLSASWKQSLAKNVYQQYTLGVHQRVDT